MRSLLPTLKERKRYIVYELITNKKDTLEDPQKELVLLINEKLGIFDSADAGVQALKYNKNLQVGLLRVSHKMDDKVRVILSMITKIEHKNVLPRTRGVSGIIKKTERFFPKERNTLEQIKN